MPTLYCNKARLTQATELLIVEWDGQIIAEFASVGGLNAYLVGAGLSIGAYQKSDGLHVFALVADSGLTPAIEDDVPA